MPFYSDRILLKALIVSLLAHAFLLLEVPQLLPVRPDAPPGIITVSMQRAGSGTPQRSAPQPEIKATEKPAVPKIPELLKKNTRVLAVRDQPSSSTVSPPSAALAVAPDAVAASSASVPARGLASGSVGDSPAADNQVPGPGFQPSKDEGISAEEVRMYRTSLAISARRFKRYPALAKERGWEGSVEIALDFRRLRRGQEVSVASSSGRQILDDQALEMIRQAVRVTDLPAGLRERNFRVLLPIAFNLNDEH